MRALQDQQQLNQKLQEYVDKLVIRIMESNPALLEVDKDKKL